MGRAAVLVDPTSLAIQTTFTKRLSDSDNATGPLSGQSLILLGKWLECAPKYRLRSILKKLCEEKDIADEVFIAMTARDCEIAERELLETGECPDYTPKCLDLIREQKEHELTDVLCTSGASNHDGMRGDYALAEVLKQRGIGNDGAQTGGIARKRKAKQHNSDGEEVDDEEYESDQPCEPVHKRSRIGNDGIILKEKKRVRSVESLDDKNSKKQHRQVAKCENCEQAFDVGLKDQTCQYHPCDCEVDESYAGWEGYDMYDEGRWEALLDDEGMHNEHPDGFKHYCCGGNINSKGCEKGVHVPGKSQRVHDAVVLSEKNA